MTLSSSSWWTAAVFPPPGGGGGAGRVTRHSRRRRRFVVPVRDRTALERGRLRSRALRDLAAIAGEAADQHDRLHSARRADVGLVRTAAPGPPITARKPVADRV